VCDLTFVCLRGIDVRCLKMREEKSQQRGRAAICEAHKFGSGALSKIVDLARQELRERGVTEEQIEELLNRRYASEQLWEPAER
jgi:hypothetical protein